MATLVILIWPAAAARPPAAPGVDRYFGADHQARRSGPVAGFPLRLHAAGAEPTVVAPTAVPVLVGLAGRRAYLRSADSGEVEGVSIGQTLDGWRLVAVTGRSATVRGPAGDRSLELFAATEPTSDAAPDPATDPAAGG
ncbi:hypothetical protein [Brevundimonas sp.]|uniref:hypothetical protein n=1 Tax=Brevundimonas sp. TaxID=1871086 RepID=UPI002D77BA04|nr:hypothetical protein [Brevundimonas sp.]